ncbi:threonine-phosphate decarboxylase [Halorientalis sp. IM1011]|uniref:threonine-phosphate decarboxylase CobD n=1 Tax=Halorientalis sp. IM1011 TaxID=1932360 RepID=UPI00097CC237|nr:threonine-phosphate decarboxylase CobD [Halorientalis sp. IM1011]AQL42060.1 threonine-phosphate decarboxylase [Halorientalis sp. IM1011]
MDPDAVDALLSTGDGGDDPVEDGARVPHGGSDDRHLLDFSANTNPQYPTAVPRIFETALPTAREYPADDYCSFRVAAGEYVGCNPESVIPTAGGLAAIRLAMGTVVHSGDSVLVPAPTFSEYAREVRLQGGEPEFVPHDELLAADPAGHAMVAVCNPNNPTGELYDADRLREYAERCRQHDTVLLVDEAFLDFTEAPSLAGEPGVIVARSLTKMFGLPGLRAGFAVATGKLRERLAAARLTWSLSEPAAAVGAHCMRQTEFVAETRQRIARERPRMASRLGDRFDVFDSDAPFLLCDAGSSEAVEDVVAEAREHDIAIRDARTFRGLDSHFRVAVRMSAENDRLLAALGV